MRLLPPSHTNHLHFLIGRPQEAGLWKNGGKSCFAWGWLLALASARCTLNCVRLHFTRSMRQRAIGLWLLPLGVRPAGLVKKLSSSYILYVLVVGFFPFCKPDSVGKGAEAREVEFRKGIMPYSLPSKADIFSTSEINVLNITYGLCNLEISCNSWRFPDST